MNALLILGLVVIVAVALLVIILVGGIGAASKGQDTNDGSNFTR